MSVNRLLVLGLVALAVFAVGFAFGSIWAKRGSESWGATLRRLVKPLLIIGVVVFVGIQFVPYGRDHDNPPVVAEPDWDSAETRELAVAACFDCHSNETAWPWYSNIAPVSWFVQRDVDDGRSSLNWSEWVDGEEHGDESAETVEEGSMPLRFYSLLHSEARLDQDQLDTLAAGLETTFGRRS